MSGTVSVDLAGLTLSFTPSGTVSSSFTGSTSSVTSSDVYSDTFGPGSIVFTGSSDKSLKVPTFNPDDPDTPYIVSIKGTTTPRGTVNSTFIGNPVSTSLSGSASGSVSGLYVSPSNFRFAMTLQHIKEMQAQIDNRYQSYIHKFFGARARDYRLDRPEFIGGSVFELNVSDVTQTSETTETSNLADVAGKSVTADTSRTIRYHADEHCIILGTVHIIPDTEYINGLSRVDSTKDRFDWVLPQFGHLSEQAVYNSELVYNNDDDDSVVFGYEPIYNNLRWRKNFATCDFRDVFNYTGNREEYKPWLQVKDYGNLVSVGSSDLEFAYKVPTLSDQFLSGRYNRDNSNFVVTDDNLVFPFMVDSYFKQRMVRIIPSRGTPTRLGA